MTKTQLLAENGRLKAMLGAISDYGIDTTAFGDGDASALWSRIDAFRADAEAVMSPEDVRETIEWWAELHGQLMDLEEAAWDAKAVLGMIDNLRQPEGCSVEILCQNPEGEPIQAILATRNWDKGKPCFFAPRRFEGDAVIECLKKAVAAVAEGER